MKAWVIKQDRCLLPWVIASTRRDVIARAERFFGEPWAKMVADSRYMAVKVDVQEITKEGKHDD